MGMLFGLLLPRWRERRREERAQQAATEQRRAELVAKFRRGYSSANELTLRDLEDVEQLFRKGG